jgi:hypothetical protein
MQEEKGVLKQYKAFQLCPDCQNKEIERLEKLKGANP